MTKIRPAQVFPIGVLLAGLPAMASAQREAGDPITALVKRDSITVLVTDSGLGGLSVVADIEVRARDSRFYRSLTIVFANALPEASRGYNKMKSVEEKIRVFQDALAGMIRWYRPDIILVACNTLSVLIPGAHFAKEIPVLGIVEPGVVMLEEALKKDSNTTAIIFGTETTIKAGTHRLMLLERGIRPERIVEQACPGLAGEIESDAGSDLVAASVELFAGEAVGRMERKTNTIVAGLCCTHYGYCSDRFEAALQPFAPGRVRVVNPNVRMSDVLFPADKKAVAGKTIVSVRVVSRALISDAEVRSITNLLEPVSRVTAAALREYEQKRDLFPFEDR